MQIRFTCLSCLPKNDGYIGKKITFGDELAFHRWGLCVSSKAHVTEEGGVKGKPSSCYQSLRFYAHNGKCKNISKEKALYSDVFNFVSQRRADC